ncbi:MAG: PKD domain-containing protein [Bacteroidetes bacterium]|nr:PKD domain-containing protein [Bacteroidota bacterium]
MKLALIVSLLFINSVSVTAQVNLNKGLVAWFPFNGDTKDYSGNNNHPVFDNTSTATGRAGEKGTARYFNGRNNYLRIANNPSVNPKEFTLMAIVKPMGFYNGNCYNNSIIDKGRADYIRGVYGLRFTAGEYTLGDCSDPSPDHQNFVGTAYINAGCTSKELYVRTNTWYCVIYTFSQNSSKMYVNGRLISSSENEYAVGSNTDDLFIGRKESNQFPYWFNGIMDEIRIYNRPLSQEEVTALCDKKNDPPAPDLSCSPENKFAANFNYTVNNCFNVAFKLTDSKLKKLKSVYWTFGDGSSSQKTMPEHQYVKEGTYKITAITTSISGCRDTITRKIQLQSLQVDYTFSEEGNPGEIRFKVKNNLAYYRWQLGDETTVGGESTFSHRYAQSGEYTAILIAKNNAGCRDTVRKRIAIRLPDSINSIIAATTTEPVAIFNPLPVSLEKRDKEVAKDISVQSDSVRLLIYDNGIIDGDSITLVYNNEVILTHQHLTAKPLVIVLKLDPALKTNELQMYAENLGSIPPNTALLIADDGKNRYTVNLSCTQKTNGTVYFSRKLN